MAKDHKSHIKEFNVYLSANKIAGHSKYEKEVARI